MSAFATHRPVKEAPLLLADIARMGPDWQDSFAWPIPLQTHFRAAAGALDRSVALLATLPDDQRSVALLGRTFNRAAVLLEAAHVIAAEDEAGVSVVGPADLDVLRGGQVAGGQSATVLMRPRAGSVRFPGVRRIVRTATWTRPDRLLRTILAPEALAVSHNPLLRRHAAKLGLRVAFAQADQLLQDVAAGAGAALLSPASLDDLAAQVTRSLTADPNLTPELRARLEGLLSPLVMSDLSAASSLLGNLRGARNLPKNLWSGTGGLYAARALGLEVMRRGGSVVRHDHGGTVSLMDGGAFLSQQELAVSTCFVAPTDLAATTASVMEAVDLLARRSSIAIASAGGDPSLDPGRPAKPRKADPGRRNVLFVGTAYYGFSQTWPPFPPPAYYLWWQHRVLRELRALPVNLLHKPHPGGLCRGAPPGLGALANISTQMFEEALAWADVFVFDIAASTTFSIALCTDRPVVLLDFGCMGFNETVSGEISRRCRVVPVQMDTANRPFVSQELLREAVCGGSPSEEPGFFRKLFLDES